MKIILNPKYAALRDYLAHLEEHFEHEGHEIHRGRNVIRTLEVDGLTLCVKRFAAPSFRRKVQQFIYKSSKGKLAFFRPLLLRERGFESPESVAFVRFSHGLLPPRHTTYFVSLFSSYRYTMADLAKRSPERQREIIEHFARFAAHLHEGGFLHKDFSSSNILYDKIGDRYHFSLVDTNNIKAGTAVSIEQGCRNLAQLTGDDAFFALLAECYARQRKADPAHCAQVISEARRRL